MRSSEHWEKVKNHPALRLRYPTLPARCRGGDARLWLRVLIALRKLANYCRQVLSLRVLDNLVRGGYNAHAPEWPLSIIGHGTNGMHKASQHTQNSMPRRSRLIDDLRSL